jgi:uncharacterized membrane protein
MPLAGPELDLILMILTICLVMSIVALMVFMGMYVYYTKRDKQITRRTNASIRRQISATGPHTRIQIV